MNNPPAFPRAASHYSSNPNIYPVEPVAPQNGMSLLDHFAGLAMAAQISSPGASAFAHSDDGKAVERLCQRSYAIATQMLAEREAKR